MIPGRRGVDKRSNDPENRRFWNSTFRSPPAQAQMSQVGDTSFGVLLGRYTPEYVEDDEMMYSAVSNIYLVVRSIPPYSP